MNYKVYFEVLQDVFGALNEVLKNYEYNIKRYNDMINNTNDDDSITYYEELVSEYKEKNAFMEKIYSDISKQYIKEVK